MGLNAPSGCSTVLAPSMKYGARLPRPAMWNSGEVQKPTDSGVISMARIQVSAWAFMLAWVSTAPLGLPVVPEVYMISEGVSSGMSRGACGAPSSARASS
ncbi:Uncharacterised protein [Mycobacteroides abscessus subsp. abscessus]|nr:Uncharacterised protein [Mycobacteroides abscessus subsp. abscessus]